MPQVSGYDRRVDQSDREALRWRAWVAYQQLPYEDNGELPKKRAIERAFGLPNSTFTKLFRGRLIQPGPSVARRIAAALRVDPDWLWEGKGSGPATVRGVPPLPKISDGGVTVPVISDGGREGTALQDAGFRQIRVIRRGRRRR
jgi:hypothetical protein